MSCDANIYTVPVPGPAGPAGANGADGADGVSAFTYTTAIFAMPAELVTVVVQVIDSTPFSVGQVVFVAAGAQGYFEVTARPTNTSLALRNLKNTASNVYMTNSAPGTLFPSGSKVSPAGLQGPQGASLTGAFLIANNLSEGVAATMRSNLGLGSIATYTYGTTAGQVPNVHTTLVAGESVWFTGVGWETKTAANARTALGLGSVAVLPAGQTDGRVPKVDQVGGLINGQVVFSTASGLETKTAANARIALGITNGVMAMVTIVQQELTTVDGGDFLTGGWRKVPLNTVTVDTESIASVLSNEFTLPAGSYRYRFGVLGFGVGYHQGRLYNVTAGSVVPSSYGSVVRTSVDSTESSAVGDIAPGEGRFTIAVTSTLRLEGQCQASNALFGFGSAASFGGPEVYSYITLEKELS